MSDPDRVAVIVPAATEHLRILRLNAAAATADLLTVDEIEDLKIAVEELAGGLLSGTGGPTLELVLRVDEAKVVVSGRREAIAGEMELSEYAPVVLDALVDDYTFGIDGADGTFSLTKYASGR